MIPKHEKKFFQNLRCSLNFASFVDVGCGNGLLTFLLNAERVHGCGIDARRRRIWERFALNGGDLRQTSIDASDEMCTSLPPSADFLIGNHNDELTPWLPVMAARFVHAIFNNQFFCFKSCLQTQMRLFLAALLPARFLHKVLQSCDEPKAWNRRLALRAISQLHRIDRPSSRLHNATRSTQNTVGKEREQFRPFFACSTYWRFRLHLLARFRLKAWRPMSRRKLLEFCKPRRKTAQTSSRSPPLSRCAIAHSCRTSSARNCRENFAICCSCAAMIRSSAFLASFSDCKTSLALLPF